MIDDMASLKQAMEQMDAEDIAVAQAARDRAAQILREAKLSFSKIAELIEQRRLLLRPKIVTSIKRMDQFETLGDAAFRETGSLLRRGGQSFGQIAEAIEFSGRPAHRYEDPEQKSEPLHQMEMESEPGAAARLRVPAFVARIVFFPLRHPIQFLVTAFLAIWLFNALRDFVTAGQQGAARQLADAALSSVSSFVDKRISRQSQQAAAPPTPATPSLPSTTPSVGPATAPAPPATTPAPSANESAPPALPPAAPAGPTASTPRLDSAAKNRPRTVQPRAFEYAMPEEIRRNSQMAGPCIGGVGGCYWGGGHY
jgi:hypothetical protein